MAARTLVIDIDAWERPEQRSKVSEADLLRLLNYCLQHDSHSLSCKVEALTISQGHSNWRPAAYSFSDNMHTDERWGRIAAIVLGVMDYYSVQWPSSALH